MFVKDNMSLRKRSTVTTLSAMLLMLSLLLQCAVFTAAAATSNANASKTNSIANRTHIDNQTHNVTASKSITNAKTAIKPASTGVNSAKSPPVEPVKPTKNNGKPVDPLSTLSKVNNAGNANNSTRKNNQTVINNAGNANNSTIKNNQTVINNAGNVNTTGKSNQTAVNSAAKTVKAKNVNENAVLKTNATSKPVKIKDPAGTGSIKINQTSPPASKVNETTTKRAGTIQKTTAYPILDEAESMFWSSEDDDVPDTKPAINAPVTSREGINPFHVDLPEPIHKPKDDSLELLLVAEEGSGETTDMTASTTTTTTVATTTTTTMAPTTTGLLATVPPSYEKIDPNFGMNFDLSIQVAYEEYLEDPEDPRYQALAKEVEDVVNKAFEGCWGFVEDSARVLDFYNATWRGQATKGAGPGGYNSPEALAGEGFDSTGANYNVTFETAKVFEHPDWVYEYIATNATYILENSTIANSSVSAGDMTQDAQDQIKDLTAHPCTVLICPSCYGCLNSSKQLGNASTVSAYCSIQCNLETEQCSIVDNTNDQWIGECTCKKGYLPIGDDCADQDVVIGVSVGIGLFIIAVFAGIITYMCCKDRKKNKASDTEASVANAYQDVTVPEETKIDPPAVEIVAPSAPIEHARAAPIEHATTSQEQSIQPTASPKVTAAVVSPRDDEDEEDEVIINFKPNLSNVDDEYLSKSYAITRARVRPPSLDEPQDYLRDNFYF